MTSRHKISNLFLAGIFIAFGLFLLVGTVSAATSTVIGKAYWGEYGYVYFNCNDDVIGNRLNESQNLAGGVGRYKIPPAAAAFHFYSEPCTDIVHGVTVDNDKLLAGDAWNPTLGLISFDGNFAPNYSFNSHCSKCTSTNSCTACYNEDEQKVYGWARVDSTGELISLDSAETPPVGLFLDGDNPPYPGYNIDLGDFTGKASSLYGPLSFHCETENYPSGTCASREYKVYIKDLILGKMSAPNWTHNDACLSGALKAVLKWKKMSGTQTAYEVVVNDSPSFSTSTGDYVCWSEKKLSAVAEQYIIPNADPNCQTLEYNKAYYWWLRGYDADGNPTAWRQYDTNAVTSTDGNSDGDPLTFQTFRHEFPSPFFTWSPFNVITGTTTTFTSAGSMVYTDASPSTPLSCEPGRCSYLWSTSDLFATTTSLTAANIDINFFTATNTSVTLATTDASNYTCSFTMSFRTNYDLPIWREVRAE